MAEDEEGEKCVWVYERNWLSLRKGRERESEGRLLDGRLLEAVEVDIADGDGSGMFSMGREREGEGKSDQEREERRERERKGVI